LRVFHSSASVETFGEHLEGVWLRVCGCGLWVMSRYLTLAAARLTASLSGAGCGHGFPLGHCLQAMKMNLEGEAF
jgi:hypothetical protein